MNDDERWPVVGVGTSKTCLTSWTNASSIGGTKNEVSEFGIDTFVRKAIRQKNSSIDAQ